MSFEVTDILSLIESPDWPPDHWRTTRPFTRLRQTGVNARWAWGDDKQHIGTDPDRTVLWVPRQTGSDEDAIDAWFAERRPKVRAIIGEADDVIFDEEIMLEHLKLANFTQGRTDEQIRQEARMARYFARQCDGYTVTSEPLAEMVRSFTDRPVIVLPNAIDTRWFRAQMAYKPGWSEYLTIGWSGGRRPERDILPMAQAWGRVAKRYPHVRFVVAAAVVPDAFYRFVEDDSRIIRLPFLSLGDYPVAYQTSIGCCSVADTVFSRAKTSIKLYEYTIAGAAVVGTEVLYGGCLQHGGYVANTADEWEHALSFLVERPDVRAMVAADLLTHVERHHSLDTQLYRWPDAYRMIVDSMAGVAV